MASPELKTGRSKPTKSSQSKAAPAVEASRKPSHKLAKWPRSEQFNRRYRVLDLIPEDVASSRLKAIFIGESPHRDEVAPESAAERSPFRGVAGREWWAELVRFTGDPIVTRPVPPRKVLLEICSELQIGVMNAVQFPIDRKIMMHQGDASDPVVQLGFDKSTGSTSYKAVFKVQGQDGPVGSALDDLRARLQPLARPGIQWVCLGNDSRWFVERIHSEFSGLKPLLTIPHPSSWWRNAAYKARAVETLQALLG